MFNGSNMYCMNRSLALFFVFVVCGTVMAEEGGGEGAAPAAKEKKEKPTAAAEFQQKVTKLNTIETRMEDAQTEFDHLVSDKEHTTDQKQVEAILKQMVEVNKQRNKDAEEYNAIKQELAYRYPSKAAELNRLYQLQQKRSMDEMQSGADLDDMLTRIKKVIERKFAPFNPEKDKVVTAVPTEAPEEPKKLRLEK